jgi:hypothetical protein
MEKDEAIPDENNECVLPHRYRASDKPIIAKRKRAHPHPLSDHEL